MIGNQAQKLEELVASNVQKKSKKTRFVAITSGLGRSGPHYAQHGHRG